MEIVSGNIMAMKKAIILLWFLLLFFLYGVMLHPSELKRALLFLGDNITNAHDVIRPLLFRPSRF